MNKVFKTVKALSILLLVVGIGTVAVVFYLKFSSENKILHQIISRLESDSRIAEVLVTGVNYNEATGKTITTIKFLEYDSLGAPLKPRYFTFSGNIIQFQSLVIRFDDRYIRMGDKLRGKSIYLFWKVFMLDGKNTEEYEITSVNSIPEGYKLNTTEHAFENNIWEKFWDYALKEKEKGRLGIKNAQIEAPGLMFVPGILYSIKIEHDGGMRIDTNKLPEILKGETIL
ncbi:MAG: hypothetical protein ABH848_02925 [Candidatus Omnitrophota bacterium]